jgi:hypothetical protein
LVWLRPRIKEVFMAINFAGSAPGPTAGPAKEVSAVQLIHIKSGW